MKRTTGLFTASMIAFGALFYTACHEEGIDSNSDLTIVQETEDVEDHFASLEEGIDEITNTLTSGSELKLEGYYFSACSVERDTVERADKSIHFSFNGDNCRGTRTRTGTIIVRLIEGNSWKDKGAKIELTFIDFKVTRKSDGKSVLFNGKKTIRNVNGGLQPTPSNEIVHSIRGTLHVAFDNGTSRSWKLSKKRTISISDNEWLWKIESDSVGTTISETGINRAGKPFTVRILNPVIVKRCGEIRKPIDGIIEYSVESKIRIVEFGYKLDLTGLPVQVKNCESEGKYLSWTNGTRNLKRFVPYRN